MEWKILRSRGSDIEREWCWRVRVPNSESHEEEVDQLRELELPLGSEENEEQMENGRASQVRPFTNYSPFSYPISLNRKGEKVRAKMDKKPREKREAREGKRLVDLAGWKLQFVVARDCWFREKKRREKGEIE